jgi:hypothetical protein
MVRDDSDRSGTSCWSERMPIAAPSQSLAGGAWRKLRQYTRSKVGTPAGPELCGAGRVRAIEQADEPLLVESGVYSGRLLLHCRPQVASLRGLVFRREAARLEQHSNHGLKPLAARPHDAALPILQRAHADAGARCELALDQACTNSITQ